MPFLTLKNWLVKVVLETTARGGPVSLRQRWTSFLVVTWPEIRCFMICSRSAWILMKPRQGALYDRSWIASPNAWNERQTLVCGPLSIFSVRGVPLIYQPVSNNPTKKHPFKRNPKETPAIEYERHHKSVSLDKPDLHTETLKVHQKGKALTYYASKLGMSSGWHQFAECSGTILLVPRVSLKLSSSHEYQKHTGRTKSRKPDVWWSACGRPSVRRH